MLELGIWYSREVQKWRTTASVLWVTILATPVTFLFLLLAKMSFIHPFTWIADGIISLFNMLTWFYIGLSVSMFTLLAVWNTNYYTVCPVILTTRLAHMIHILNIQHLLHAFGHGAAFAVAAWCYTSLLDNHYSSLSRKCVPESPLWCLNEQHLFVVLHGVFAGILYAVNFIGRGQNFLRFPIVQQPKFFIVKSQIFALVVSSVVTCLKNMRVYYLLYYFLIGPFAREWISTNMDLKEGDNRLGFVGLIDMNLFWHTLLSGTWMLLIVNMARNLYTVYQTQPFEFDISAPFDGKEDRCLHKALASVHNPLVHHLGYLDLKLLAKQDVHRRAELFSLSQPGGHPHNWNNVSAECFKTLGLLTERITEFNEKASVASGQARQLSGEKTPLVKQPAEVDVGHGSPSTLRQRNTPVSTLGPNLASDLLPAKSQQQTVHERPSAVNRFTEHVKKRKAVAFFLTELPESQSQRLFVDAQVHIWVVEALTELTVASYEEDKFGVVQKTLSDILTTLLMLQDAVEKFCKLAPGSTKKDGLKCGQEGVTRNSLKATLKSAIYRMVNTFGKHVNSVPLSQEHKRKLLQFVDYRE